MVIKILIACAGTDPLRNGYPYDFREGEIDDVPDHVAVDLIKYGMAQSIDPDQSPPQSLAVTPQIKRGKVANTMIKRRQPKVDAIYHP